MKYMTLIITLLLTIPTLALSDNKAVTLDDLQGKWKIVKTITDQNLRESTLYEANEEKHYFYVFTKNKMQQYEYDKGKESIIDTGKIVSISNGYLMIPVNQFVKDRVQVSIDGDNVILKFVDKSHYLERM